MKRRSVLKGLAAVPVGFLRAQQPAVPPKPAPAAVDEFPVIESTIPDGAATTVQTFFSKEQFEALNQLCDILYPSINGVPGALTAGVPAFLGFLIGQSPASTQDRYREGLDKLNQQSQQEFGVPFSRASESQAESLLAALNQRWSADPDPFVVFLRGVKDDVLTATQNSQEWSSVMSKRVRSAAGAGFYWYPIN